MKKLMKIIKRNIFLFRLNKILKKHKCSATFQKVGKSNEPDILQINIQKEFTHVELSEHNYSKDQLNWLIGYIELEVTRKIMKTNLEKNT